MGNTYRGKTEEGAEWTIKVLKDKSDWRVWVFEASKINSYKEPNLYFAEQRVRRIIGRRDWRPM